MQKRRLYTIPGSLPVFISKINQHLFLLGIAADVFRRYGTVCNFISAVIAER